MVDTIDRDDDSPLDCIPARRRQTTPSAFRVSPGPAPRCAPRPPTHDELAREYLLADRRLEKLVIKQCRSADVNVIGPLKISHRNPHNLTLVATVSYVADAQRGRDQKIKERCEAAREAARAEFGGTGPSEWMMIQHRSLKETLAKIDGDEQAALGSPLALTPSGPGWRDEAVDVYLEPLFWRVGVLLVTEAEEIGLAIQRMRESRISSGLDFALLVTTCDLDEAQAREAASAGVTLKGLGSGFARLCALRFAKPPKVKVEVI